MNGTLQTSILLLLFCGIIAKSAQFPFNTWLPDAMQGPTPISALIHAATMVVAGIFLLFRISPLLSYCPFASNTLLVIGTSTMLIGALLGCFQNDIKKILAYSTISQLGYMVVALAILQRELALFHLYTHAFFKALLFLGAGSIIHLAKHEQNIWKMGGIIKSHPQLALYFFVGCLSLIGFPYISSGFFSKEAIVLASYQHEKILFSILICGVFLTSFYTSRLFIVTFLMPNHQKKPYMTTPLPKSMNFSLAFLTFFSCFSAFPFVKKCFYPFSQIPTVNHNTHLIVLATSLSAILVAIFIVFILYKKSSKEYSFITTCSGNFMRPIFCLLINIHNNICKICATFDKFIFQKVFGKLLGYSTLSFGKLLGKLQTSYLPFYLLFICFSIIIIILTTFFT